jgi:hypothetical protein
MKKFLLTLLIVSIFTGCAKYGGIGLQKYSGFTELVFPNNNFKAGQIVEIYSSPKKVEITFQPNIPWDQAHVSEGWDISGIDTSNIKSSISTEISKILKGKYKYVSSKNIKVSFTNTKTRLVFKNIIFSKLKKSLIKNENNIREQIIMYMKEGTQFDVITNTLSANIKFSLVDNDNNEVLIDSDIIKKLNADLHIDFAYDKNNKKLISGKNLIIGIHTDPRMIRLLINNL